MYHQVDFQELPGLNLYFSRLNYTSSDNKIFQVSPNRTSETPRFEHPLYWLVTKLSWVVSLGYFFFKIHTNQKKYAPGEIFTIEKINCVNIPIQKCQDNQFHGPPNGPSETTRVENIVGRLVIKLW